LNIKKIQSWLSDIGFKRLCLAILLSALLHLLLIGKANFIGLPTSTDSRVVLDANIVLTHPKPATEKIAKLAPLPTKSKPKPKAPKPKVKPEPVPEVIEEVPALLSTVPVTQPEASGTGVANETIESTVENSHDEEAAVLANSQASPDYVFTPEPEPLPYQYVETDFDIYVNDDQARAGKAKIVYNEIQGHHYQLKWAVEATGVLALFYPDVVQTSEGMIGENGLRPEQYLYRLGGKQDKTYLAKFNWLDYKVVMVSSKGEKIAELTDKTQDLLSFMYQYMYAPPLSDMQINITNGKKVAEYDYVFVGEETLELKFANVKTYHIKHFNADSDDKTELWLAKDYHFVPVKIKKTEKDGTAIEQVATSLITKDQIENIPLP
jgi:hypothetical protein